MPRKTTSPVLAILLPAFNEEKVIDSTIHSLRKLLGNMKSDNLVSSKSFICFVDDGSSDNTWDCIKTAHTHYSNIKGIRLSRNFGHQNALLSGLMTLREKTDCIVCLDVDLQQDEQMIPEFIREYFNGADIVLGIRHNRQTDSLYKRSSASFFYMLMKKFGANITPHHADYRLMSRKALTVLADYKESNLFLRGIINNIGLPTAHVYFDVRHRTIGESKYSFAKMLAFSLDGITSFSVVPLRLVALTGLLISLCSLLMTCYVLYIKFMVDMAVPGWASIVIPIYFLGGIGILCLGIIGEYLGKVVNEVKKRPRFINQTELL